MTPINDLLTIIPNNIVSLLTGKLLGDANLNLQVGKDHDFTFHIVVKTSSGHIIVTIDLKLFCHFLHLSIQELKMIE